MYVCELKRQIWDAHPAELAHVGYGDLTICQGTDNTECEEAEIVQGLAGGTQQGGTFNVFFKAPARVKLERAVHYDLYKECLDGSTTAAKRGLLFCLPDTRVREVKKAIFEANRGLFADLGVSCGHDLFAVPDDTWRREYRESYGEDYLDGLMDSDHDNEGARGMRSEHELHRGSETGTRRLGDMSFEDAVFGKVALNQCEAGLKRGGSLVIVCTPFRGEALDAHLLLVILRLD